MYTGDIGAWFPGGTLCIIYRVNNILKLSNAEFVQPERAMCSFPMIQSAFVYGSTINSWTVAVVVLNVEMLRSFAESRGLDNVDLETLKPHVVKKLKRRAMRLVSEVMKSQQHFRFNSTFQN